MSYVDEVKEMKIVPREINKFNDKISYNIRKADKNSLLSNSSLNVVRLIDDSIIIKESELYRIEDDIKENIFNTINPAI